MAILTDMIVDGMEGEGRVGEKGGCWVRPLLQISARPQRKSDGRTLRGPPTERARPPAGDELANHQPARSVHQPWSVTSLVELSLDRPVLT